MILIWGTTWAAIRIGLEDVPPLTGVALRFGVASALLLALAAVLRVPIASSRERALWVVHGVLSFTVSYSVTYWAEQWIPSGLAAVLFATFPLFVGLLAHLILPAERLTLLAVAGILLGFFGVATIFSEDLNALAGPGVVLAAGVMLLSPLAAAMGNVAVKRWGSGIHPVSLNAGGMLLTTGVVGGAALALERGRPLDFTPQALGSILYLAVMGSAVAFSLYFWLLQHVRATRLALVAYGIPIVAVAVGALAFDEPVTLRVILGAVLVLAGCALATRRGGAVGHQSPGSPSAPMPNRPAGGGSTPQTYT